MSNFKLGRRKPDLLKMQRSIKLGHILKTGVSIPPHPASEDYLSSLSGWQMNGNDQYGDCVSCCWANSRKVVTDYLSSNEDYPTQDEVIQFYKTQNPNFPTDDNGMDMQLALKTLIDQGGADGVKAVAFASVDYTNADEVKAALAIFGFLWLGINVFQENIDDDFNNGKPWQYYPNSQTVGGHAILTAGYLGKSSNDLRFITWAQETGMTDDFWKNEVEEAWVCIYPEHLGSKEFIAGIDLNQLATDYQALTGNTLPVPIPPAPTPSPSPVPSPAPQPSPSPSPVPPQPTPTPVPTKKSWWQRFWEWFVGLFSWN